MLRLQTKGSVEERVLETSAQKRSLADRSITGTLWSILANQASFLRPQFEFFLLFTDFQHMQTSVTSFGNESTQLCCMAVMHAFQLTLVDWPPHRVCIKHRVSTELYAWQGVSLMGRLEQMRGVSTCWISSSALLSRTLWTLVHRP